jgi:uncharacterized repeat protein (TIGR04042 family)
MPETRFTVRWPDGAQEVCWSPSTIIMRHLEGGRAYALSDFLSRARAGLTAASERVRERYGSPCPVAARQLAAIERTAARHAGAPGATVLCVSLVVEGASA